MNTVGKTVSYNEANVISVQTEKDKCRLDRIDRQRREEEEENVACFISGCIIALYPT